MTAPDVVAAAAVPSQKDAPPDDGKVLRKLRPGPGLSREAVALDQKLRLRIALASLATESGYDAVTVRALIGRARISTSTFYKLYAGVEECFAGVIGTAVRGIAEEIASGSDRDVDFRATLHAALACLMESLAREPQLAQAVIVEAAAAGHRVRSEMDSALAEFEALLAGALAGAPRPAVGTTHLAVGLVAGVLRIIRKTTLTGRVAELPDLAPELADWILAIAHEEVGAFLAPRARGRDHTSPAPRISSVPPSREAIADAGRRATMAAARLAATAGLSGLTDARIRKDAGLSRREFDRHFHGVEDCFLDAIETISAMAASTADSVAGGAVGWERHIYKEVTALCALAASDPELSRLVLIEITAPGRTGLLRRERLIDRGVAHLLEQAPPERRPSELVIDASVGAIWRIAEMEVAAGRAGELPRLAPVFVYMIIATRRPAAGRHLAAASLSHDGATRRQGRL